MDTTLFICDIMGTISYNRNVSDIERRSNIENFVEALKEIKELNDSDVMLFSIFTSDKLKYMKNYYLEFIKALDGTGIVFDVFGANDTIIRDGKIDKANYNSKTNQIMDYYKSFKYRNYNITNIYCADDQSINNIILGRYFESVCVNNECECFNCYNEYDDCIIGTTLKLEDYIYTYKKTMKR